MTYQNRDMKGLRMNSDKSKNAWGVTILWKITRKI